MRLTNVAIKQTAARDKPYKLSDGKGLYCLVHPNGGRFKMMSLMSLLVARPRLNI